MYMKKLFLLFLSFCLFVITTKAQEGITIAEALKIDVHEITSLSIDGAKEAHLLHELAGFIYLDNLRIYNLTEFPIGVVELKNLQHLYIGKSSFKTLPKTRYSLLYRLNSLYIDAELTSLPDELSGISRLKRLVLSDNNLENIPDCIFKMKNLKELIINQNKIKEVSPNIGLLINLNELNLMKNKIVALPKEIGNLTSLKLLNLSNNAIENIPEEISNLGDLFYMGLEYNKIVSLPKTIDKLFNLALLSISYNPLSSLPENLFINTKISSIDLIGVNMSKKTLDILSNKYSNIAFVY